MSSQSGIKWHNTSQYPTDRSHDRKATQTRHTGHSKGRELIAYPCLLLSRLAAAAAARAIPIPIFIVIVWVPVILVVLLVFRVIVLVFLVFMAAATTTTVSVFASAMFTAATVSMVATVTFVAVTTTAAPLTKITVLIRSNIRGKVFTIECIFAIKSFQFLEREHYVVRFSLKQFVVKEISQRNNTHIIRS